MISDHRLNFITACISIALMAVLGACAPPPPAPLSRESIVSNVRIIISRDFGKTLLEDKTVEIFVNSNAMSALKQAAQVDTGYGGGFVDGIGGLRTQRSPAGNQKGDWFYYINGLEANTGAADYPLFNGDIEQWDFHSWNFRHLIPAMIGHFPEPFLNGCRGKVFPTLIVFQNNFEDRANSLKDFLNQRRVRDVRTVSEGQLIERDKGTNNLIILAERQNLIISELNRQWKRLGFFAYFEDDKLVTIDESGKVKNRYSESTGLIQATQNPWNPNGVGADENAVWVITGKDGNGLNSALDCFIHDSNKWQHCFAVIIKQGEIIKLP
jgi:hypothetical protein